MPHGCLEKEISVNLTGAFNMIKEVVGPNSKINGEGSSISLQLQDPKDSINKLPMQPVKLVCSV